MYPRGGCRRCAATRSAAFFLRSRVRSVNTDGEETCTGDRSVTGGCFGHPIPHYPCSRRRFSGGLGQIGRRAVVGEFRQGVPPERGGVSWRLVRYRGRRDWEGQVVPDPLAPNRTRRRRSATWVAMMPGASAVRLRRTARFHSNRFLRVRCATLDCESATPLAYRNACPAASRTHSEMVLA